MPKHQIKFAAARYTNQAGQVVVAHRGEVVDLPEQEAKRLDALGALAGPDEELEAPGDLLPLDEGASDDAIENYLSSGTTEEILNQVDSYPASLIEKLLVAERNGRIRRALLEGLNARVGSGTAAKASKTSALSPDDDFDGFVNASNAKEVLDWVGSDVERAQQALDVEESAEKPRKGLVEALTKLAEG